MATPALERNAVQVTTAKGKVVKRIVRDKTYKITVEFYTSGDSKSDAWLQFLRLTGDKGFLGMLENDDPQNNYTITEVKED